MSKFNNDFYDALSKKLVSVFQTKFGPDNASAAVNESLFKYIEGGMDMGYENALSWLYVAAKRKLLDNARKERKIRLKTNKMKNYSDHFDDPTKKLDEIDRLVLRKYLDAAIEKLPSRARDVMKEVINGKTNKEIAVLLNMTVSTVKSHKSRSTDFLKKNLKVDSATFKKIF